VTRKNACGTAEYSGDTGILASDTGRCVNHDNTSSRLSMGL
jgi:hypothetical protein